MHKAYDRGGDSDMSNVRHDSMSDIVNFEIGRAVAETSMAESDLGELIFCAYEDQVPEGARTVKVEAPRIDMDDSRRFRTLDNRANKRIRDYKNGVTPWPADMVRPALSVLPAEYRDRGLRKVARYLGFLGAEAPDAPEAGTDCDLLADISNGSGEALRWVVKALADGKLDQADAPMAPHIYAALGDLASLAVGGQARICARTGYQPPNGRPTLSVVDNGPQAKAAG